MLVKNVIMMETVLLVLLTEIQFQIVLVFLIISKLKFNTNVVINVSLVKLLLIANVSLVMPMLSESVHQNVSVWKDIMKITLILVSNVNHNVKLVNLKLYVLLVLVTELILQLVTVQLILILN